VISTVRSARPWRVRRGDAPAGDAGHPPTPTKALPGETSTRLAAFPYSPTELRRCPLCASYPFLVSAACPGGYDEGWRFAQSQFVECVTELRTKVHIMQDIAPQMSSQTCCGGFVVSNRQVTWAATIGRHSAECRPFHCAPSMRTSLEVKVLLFPDHRDQSEAQLRKGDRAWKGSVERTCGPTYRKRIGGEAERGGRAMNRKSR
jgi:hypothetical protein